MTDYPSHATTATGVPITECEVCDSATSHPSALLTVPFVVGVPAFGAVSPDLLGNRCGTRRFAPPGRCGRTLSEYIGGSTLNGPNR